MSRGLAAPTNRTSGLDLPFALPPLPTLLATAYVMGTPQVENTLSGGFIPGTAKLWTFPATRRFQAGEVDLFSVVRSGI